MHAMEKTLTKTSLDTPSRDFEFWQQQPVAKRLEALESIRNEYNRWKYHDQQGFQRVYRVIKLT